MPPRRKIATDTPVYQIKVTLKRFSPPIWRRVLVPADITFAELHNVIQVVMGWFNCHLHEFTVGGLHIGVPHPDDYYPVKSERRVRLNEVVSREKFRFSYQYDFGDDWQHEILVEKVLPPDPQQPLPLCIKGKRACPPEDVGGVWGYASFLEAVMDPNHEEREEMLDWVGYDFDPEAFDLDEVNTALHSRRKR
jgi:hypothetical protein